MKDIENYPILIVKDVADFSKNYGNIKPWWNFVYIICPGCKFKITMDYEKIAELIIKHGECERENFKKALERRKDIVNNNYCEQHNLKGNLAVS
jgi:hypothetical protein